MFQKLQFMASMLPPPHNKPFQMGDYSLDGIKPVWVKEVIYILDKGLYLVSWRWFTINLGV